MPVKSQDIEYAFENTRLVGELSVDDSVDGPRPAVLICHEGGGLADHTKNIARRLASLGHVAFALDYYGDGVPPPSDQIMTRIGELMQDPRRTRGIALAALDVLLADPRADRSRAAAIGYCFGGSMALELARAGTDLACVVGFHSRLSTSTPEDATNIHGKVLVCIGADDPVIPPEQRLAFEDEMRAGGVDWQMSLYGGTGHSFTNPSSTGANPGFAYNARTDARSWQAMLRTFDDAF